MTKISANPNPIPRPSTNADLIKAIDGYRLQLDEFSSRTSSNLSWLTDGLAARLAAADAAKP